MGLNNHGAAVVGDRLARTDAPVPVGVNIAKSEHVGTDGAPTDYLATYEEVAEGGTSSSSTSPVRTLRGSKNSRTRERCARCSPNSRTRVRARCFVKLSPDLPEPAAEDALDLVTELDLDGVVAVNTTTERPSSLRSDERAEQGGLSGKPIEDEATRMVRFCAERVDVPVVGVGGISTAEGAYRKIRAGASVVELYTGLVYRGPSIARISTRACSTCWSGTASPPSQTPSVRTCDRGVAVDGARDGRTLIVSGRAHRVWIPTTRTRGRNASTSPRGTTASGRGSSTSFWSAPSSHRSARWLAPSRYSPGAWSSRPSSASTASGSGSTGLPSKGIVASPPARWC